MRLLFSSLGVLFLLGQITVLSQHLYPEFPAPRLTIAWQGPETLIARCGAIPGVRCELQSSASPGGPWTTIAPVDEWPAWIPGAAPLFFRAFYPTNLFTR